MIIMAFGKYTYGTPQIKWANKDASLTVGNFCSIAGGVKIYLGGNHRSDRITTYPFGHIHTGVFVDKELAEAFVFSSFFYLLWKLLHVQTCTEFVERCMCVYISSQGIRHLH